MTLSVARYACSDRERWNAFVSSSRNGTFLFLREYMDYHADRFTDHSLLVSGRDGHVVALLPANAVGPELVSHGGLTYGGFVIDQGMTAPLMLEVFDEATQAMRAAGFDRLVYKTIPHIYHDRPAEEDLYALFRGGARLIRRDHLSVIDRGARYPYQQRRRRAVRKAAQIGLEVCESDRFDEFWMILTDTLASRYGVRPVHSLDEIELLKQRFPRQIRLFGAYRGAKMRAGVVVYMSSHVCHLQYIAASDQGRLEGALDAILDFLIELPAPMTRYLDFGASTEEHGSFLNVGLAAYKNGFGARTVVHDFYELDLTICAPELFRNVR